MSKIDPNNKAVNSSPIVSVLMITYNHEKYISQAIESIVSQICSFKFELIIGEDASTDNTLTIALEYQKRYPDIIHVIYEEKNIGMSANAVRVLNFARGQYVAYCEGDDYWCCNEKLERQVELMIRDSDVGVVHTDWVRAAYKKNSWVVNWHQSMHRRVGLEKLSGFIFPYFYFPKILRTCTVMIKKELIQAAERSNLRSKNYKFADVIYSAFVTSQSKVAYLPEITAVYRLSHNSALRAGAKARISFLFSALEFDSVAREYFIEKIDYPKEYRWELYIGIILWSIWVGDFECVRRIMGDMKEHYTLRSFLSTAMRSFLVHLPKITPNDRAVPSKVIK